MRISDWSSEVCSSDLRRSRFAAIMMIPSGMDAVAAGIDHLFTVFLGEGAKLAGRDDVEHRFGRAAELHPERCDDERAIDEDRMRHHCINECAIGEIGVA